MIFLKFALALYEGYSTLFLDSISTINICNAYFEHISVKIDSSKENCEIISQSVKTLEMIIETLIVSQFTGDSLTIST